MKRLIFPALQPGSELWWGGLAGPQAVGEAVEFFRFVVYNDPAWDFRTLRFDTAAAHADAAARNLLNVIDPNLKAFFSRGGKLLLYHGWNDQLVAPVNSIIYYTSIVREMGGERATTNSVRLFMMPGTNHCAGGEGPQHVRSHARHRTEGGTRADSRTHSRDPQHQRCGGSHQAAVPISRGGKVQGERQHRRRGELLLRGTLTHDSPLTTHY